MAITIEEFRKAAGHAAYAAYLYAARQRFEQLQAATLEQVRDLYRRAAERLAEDIRRAKAGTLTYRYKTALQEAIRARADELGEDLLQLAQQGIRGALRDGMTPAAAITIDLTRDIFEGVKVDWVFAQVAERSALVLLARTGPDGLRLSDRIWRIEAHFRQALDRLVEEALVTQMDPRRLARLVQQYVQPGVFTPLKEATRRRLKVPRDISYEAIRLARTELQHAHHEGSLLGYRMVPSYIGSYWRLSASHPKPDICDAYAARGLWPKGTEPSKPHPNCFCVLIPVFDDREQFVERLREWVKQPSTQPDIEDWFRRTMQPWMGRPIQLIGSGLLKAPRRASKPPWTKATVPGSDASLASPVRDGLLAGTSAEGASTVAAVTIKDRQRVKQEIMRSLAARLRGHPEFEAMAREYVTARRTGRWSRDPLEDWVAELIHTWAVTSADDRPMALALQLAAEDEFGLRPWKPFRKRRHWREAEQIYSKWAPALRAFLRAQYEQTQEWLRARGIKKVWLWRGMSLEKSAPAQYRKLHGFGQPTLKLQPLSSFSVEFEIARLFAGSPGIIVAAEVPAERILSTARTGFGCLNEGELVVLSGPGKGWAWTWRTLAEMPGKTDFLSEVEAWPSRRATSTASTR